MNCTDCGQELLPGPRPWDLVWVQGETAVCAYCMGKAWVILMADLMSSLS